MLYFFFILSSKVEIMTLKVLRFTIAIMIVKECLWS